jgi:hypothetical protein
MSEITELLERFRRGPELVAMAMTGAAGAELDFTPAPGKWSLRQILCHLADSEMEAGIRMRRIIAEDNPTLIGYDQDAWAVRLDYSRRKTTQALETFRHIRGLNYELLQGLPEEAFGRQGTHTERGTVTLLDLLRIYARHAEKHAEQIQAVRQAYRQFREAERHS